MKRLKIINERLAKQQKTLRFDSMDSFENNSFVCVTKITMKLDLKSIQENQSPHNDKGQSSSVFLIGLLFSFFYPFILYHPFCASSNRFDRPNIRRSNSIVR
ncbi:Hypothetical protein NH340_JMT06425 [Sarcoptes scabiei]|nr:Hypothetical protein NH340_JMT06425 [Sarcoptes scabiei]